MFQEMIFMVHGLDAERTAPGLRAHRVDDPTTAGTFHPLLVATVPPGAALTVGSVNRSRSGAASGGLDRRCYDLDPRRMMRSRRCGMLRGVPAL